MCMMPLHLHVNQKSDYDVMIMITLKLIKFFLLVGEGVRGNCAKVLCNLPNVLSHPRAFKGWVSECVGHTLVQPRGTSCEMFLNVSYIRNTIIYG